MTIALGLPVLGQDPEEPRPGLLLIFERLSPPADKGGTGGRAADGQPSKDSRVARLASLYIPEGSPPTPFLTPGRFRATWRGFLEAEFLDDYTFSVEGRGTFSLTLNGEKVLEAQGDDLSRASPETVELEQGRNRLVARYESPARGDAMLRLYWSSYEFPREPIPPMTLSHDGADPFLLETRRLREGRELLAARRCLACHAPSSPVDGAAQGMPELAMDAPSLGGIGSRLNTAWVALWIDNPRALRSDATMPRLVHHPEPTKTKKIDRRAWDMAAYLSTLNGEPTRVDTAANADAAERGSKLFDQLGCIGCHTLPGDEGSKEEAEDRRPLSHIHAKWKPRALRRFLLRPERNYAWIRMPNFKLNEVEAQALASFLLSESRKESAQFLPATKTAGDPARGSELVESSGCLNCHGLEVDTKRAESSLEAPGLAALRESDWERGCLAEAREARGSAPDFQLTERERGSLQAFARVGWPSLQRHSPVEFARRQIEALRCTACHVQDGELDVWSKLTGGTNPLAMVLDPPANPAPPALDGEEKTIDQSRPHLTWVGEKLRPEWMARFLAGEITDTIRPWLLSRMPAFSQRGDVLARGLVLEHGQPLLSPPYPASDPEMAAVAKKLILGDGFNCVSCHDIGKVKALGPFEAKGVDFQFARERLRKSFYHRWMMNPQRVAPESRMPQFADDEGRSAFSGYYDGDARRQFEAIWQYLLEGREISPPG